MLAVAELGNIESEISFHFSFAATQSRKNGQDVLLCRGPLNPLYER